MKTVAETTPVPDPLGLLIRELERLSGVAESERAAADRAEIVRLRGEVAALQAAVAHLRAGTAPLPARLRTVVARAMIVAAEDAAPIPVR